MGCGTSKMVETGPKREPVDNALHGQTDSSRASSEQPSERGNTPERAASNSTSEQHVELSPTELKKNLLVEANEILDKLVDVNDPDEAIQSFEQCRELLKNTAKESSEYLGATNNAGLIYNSKGESQKALSYFEECLEIKFKKPEIKPSSLAITYNNIARTLNDLNQLTGPEGAITYFQKVTAIKETLTLEKSQELNLAYSSTTDIIKNLTTIARTPNLDQEKLNELNKQLTSLSVTYNNLAVALKTTKALNPAIDYFQKVIAIKEYAILKKSQELNLNYNSMEELIQNISKIDNQELSNLLVDLSVVYNNVGIVYREKDDLNNAKNYFTNALAIQEHKAKNTLALSDAFHGLGLIYARLGQLKDRSESYEYKANALKHMKAALCIRQELAPNTLLLAAAYNNVGNILREQGKITEAYPLFVECFRIEEEFYREKYISPATNRELVVNAHRAANVALELGKHQEALFYAGTAITRDPKLTPVYLVKAKASHKLGTTVNLECAVNVLDEALKLDPDYADAVVCKAEVLKDLAHIKKTPEAFALALEAIEKAEKIRKSDYIAKLMAEYKDQIASSKQSFNSQYQAGGVNLIDMMNLIRSTVISEMSAYNVKLEGLGHTVGCLNNRTTGLEYRVNTIESRMNNLEHTLKNQEEVVKKVKGLLEKDHLKSTQLDTIMADEKLRDCYTSLYSGIYSSFMVAYSMQDGHLELKELPSVARAASGAVSCIPMIGGILSTVMAAGAEINQEMWEANEKKSLAELTKLNPTSQDAEMFASIMAIKLVNALSDKVKNLNNKKFSKEDLLSKKLNSKTMKRIEKEWDLTADGVVEWMVDDVKTPASALGHHLAKVITSMLKNPETAKNLINQVNHQRQLNQSKSREEILVDLVYDIELMPLLNPQFKPAEAPMLTGFNQHQSNVIPLGVHGNTAAPQNQAPSYSLTAV